MQLILHVVFFYLHFFECLVGSTQAAAQMHGLVLIEVEFFCDEETVVIFFGLYVYIFVGFLGEDEFVAQLFDDGHEGVEEMDLLFLLVLLVE